MCKCQEHNKATYSVLSSRRAISGAINELARTYKTQTMLKIYKVQYTKYIKTVNFYQD